MPAVRPAHLAGLAAGALVVVTLAGVAVAVARISPIPRQPIPVVVASQTGVGPVTRDETETFAYRGVDYTIQLTVSYYASQGAFTADAVLSTSSGEAEPDGAPLLVQELDVLGSTDPRGTLYSPCTDGSPGWSTTTTRTLTPLHCGAVLALEPGGARPTGAAPTPLTVRVLVSDTGVTGYDPQAADPGVVHTYEYRVG